MLLRSAAAAAAHAPPLRRNHLSALAAAVIQPSTTSSGWPLPPPAVRQHTSTTTSSSSSSMRRPPGVLRELAGRTPCSLVPWPRGLLQQWSSSRGFLSSMLQPESRVYKERRLIGYSPEQLYEVVASVQHYSQFVPWCVGSRVTVRDEGGTYLEAELHIGFQMISERYTSKVTLAPPHSVSSTVADSGLFHHLESTWRLQPGPQPGTTWLSFAVDFAFLNPLYANVAALFFSEVVTRMMGAFEGRCKSLYGPAFVGPGGAGASKGPRTVHARHQQQQLSGGGGGGVEQQQAARLVDAASAADLTAAAARDDVREAQPPPGSSRGHHHQQQHQQHQGHGQQQRRRLEHAES